MSVFERSLCWWEHATTDIVTIHKYTQIAEDLSARYRAFKSDPHGAPFSHKRSILLPEVAAHEGRPIMMTEFGGCKVASQGEEGWGYGEAAKDYGEMVERIRSSRCTGCRSLRVSWPAQEDDFLS